MQNDTHALLKLLKNHAHIQIKTTRFRLTHHFTPIRMVIIKKMQSVGKNVENWNPRTFLMGIWCNRCGKLNTELPQKVKPRLIHIVDPVTSTEAQALFLEQKEQEPFCLNTPACALPPAFCRHPLLCIVLFVVRECERRGKDSVCRFC